MAVFKIATIGDTRDSKYFEYAEKYLKESSSNLLPKDIEFVDISGMSQEEILDFNGFSGLMYFSQIHEMPNSETLKNFFSTFNNTNNLSVFSLSHEPVIEENIDIETQKLSEYLPNGKELPKVAPVNVNTKKEIENYVQGFVAPDVISYKEITESLDHIADSKSNTLGDIVVEATLSKHEYTAGHVQRVSRYVTELAKELNFSEKEQQEVALSAKLHDIGKIFIPDKILASQKGLTPEEKPQMDYHASLGKTLLKSLMKRHVKSTEQYKDNISNEKLGLYESINNEVLKGIDYHHKDWDGYRGIRFDEDRDNKRDPIRGDDIGKYALIIAVADCLDAMTSQRAYNAPKNILETFRDISDNRGTQFKPEIADAMLLVLGKQLASIGYDPTKILPEESPEWRHGKDDPIRALLTEHADEFEINTKADKDAYSSIGIRLDRNGYLEFDGKNPPNRDKEISLQSEIDFQIHKIGEIGFAKTEEEAIQRAHKRINDSEKDGYEVVNRARMNVRTFSKETADASFKDPEYNSKNYNYSVNNTRNENSKEKNTPTKDNIQEGR